MKDSVLVISCEMCTSRNIAIAILSAIGVGVVVYYLLKCKKENYGAMKNVKHIPFNDCRRICEGYYNKCVSDFIDADPSFCEKRLNGCTAECYYTPYHRLQG